MGLKQYSQKRPGWTTPEPKGAVRANLGSGLYVIQKHAASRLHYDCAWKWTES